jgi:hypothetical protein
MFIGAKCKTTIAYVLVFLFLVSLMIFPDYSYGKKDIKYLVAIKTTNGKYLCAEDGGGSVVNATRDKIGNWETFEIVNLRRGNIALKGVYADSDDIGNRETFQLKLLKNNKVAFKTHDKKYICAEDGGGGKVVANRDKVGSWETFEVVKVEQGKSDKSVLTAKSRDRGIDFTWTKPNNTKNIIGYNLYRGTASGKQSNTPITDFPIEGTSYTDYNINSSTTYYYTLKAVYRDNSLGTSSNEVSVKAGSNTTKILLEVGSRYMYVNGKRMEIDSGKSSKVVIKNGRTFLPIRAVIEAMGGDVDWRQSDKRVSIYVKNSEINLWIGNKDAKVNGKKMETDVAPYISDSERTMLPLRFIAENLDCEVNWDGLTKQVTITIKR